MIENGEFGMTSDSDGDIEVLLVDDDKQWGRVTAKLLEATAETFTVDTVHSLSAGRERFLATDPDCIVCDYQLGDGTGIELLETVRETAPERPFVLVTGRGDESVASEAIGRSVTDYIPKSQDDDKAELLANRIQQAMSTYRTRQALKREQQSKNAALRILTATADRATIQQRFCRLLVEEHDYVGAWIGTKTEGGKLSPQTIVGCDVYVEDTITSPPESTDTSEPTVAALHRGESVIISDLSQSQPKGNYAKNWYRAAIKSGYGSAAGIPISHEGVLFGILGVYSAEHVIDDRQQRLLENFADLIGYVHRTGEWKRSLLSPEPMSIGVEIADESLPLLALATQLPSNVRIEVPSVVERSDGQTLYLAQVSGFPPKELATRIQSIDSLELLNWSYDSEVVRCDIITDEPPPEIVLADHGVQFVETTVSDNVVLISGRVSDPTMVKKIDNVVTNRYDDATVSPIWLGNDPRTREYEAATSILEPLTDRQEEILRHAFYDGYFEIPRGSTAVELSERLGIARATFTQHMRSGQRKLFEQLF